MVSSKQCELARIMTKDSSSDSQINMEFMSLSEGKKHEAFALTEHLVIEHNDSFDKAFPIMINDFNKVAAQFGIAPSTLFCVYMDIKSKQSK